MRAHIERCITKEGLRETWAVILHWLAKFFLHKTLQRLGEVFFPNAQFSRNYNACEKLGNITHLKEQNKSLKNDPKEKQFSELLEEDFKKIILNMLMG